MGSRNHSTHVISSGSVLCGLFVLTWGIMSIVSASYVPSITVPWLDRVMVEFSRFVWLPAAGLLLIVVGVSPVAAPRMRNSRTVRMLVGVLGCGFLCLGGFFVLLTLSLFWGFLYVSPLIVTGIVLIALSLDKQRFGMAGRISS